MIIQKSLSQKNYLDIKISQVYIFLLIIMSNLSYCPNLKANKQIPFDLQFSNGMGPKMILTGQVLTFRGHEKSDNLFYFKIFDMV